MSEIGFRIRATFKRPPQSLVAAFKGLPVANIADCMNRQACVDPAIRPYNKTPLLGTALTVQTVESDHLMFFKALEMALPGDVIVVAAGGVLTRA